MSLFPLTPDKLGSLICKRINRLTLFARARWHTKLRPQEAGHTHGDTHVGHRLLIQGPPPLKWTRAAFSFSCETVCRRHICDYDSYKAAPLIDHFDALSCDSLGKGFSGLLFNGPGVSNKIRMCFSSTAATRRERAGQSLRVHKPQCCVHGDERAKKEKK